MTYMSEPEAAANCLLTLINQINYLLDQQLRALEKDLVLQGGFKYRIKQEKKKQLLSQLLDTKDFLKQYGIEFDENGVMIKQDKKI